MLTITTFFRTIFEKTSFPDGLIARASAPELGHQSVVERVGHGRHLADNVLHLALVEARRGSLVDRNDAIAYEPESAMGQSRRVELQEARIKHLAFGRIWIQNRRDDAQ